jgi:hypothetical protein
VCLARITSPYTVILAIKKGAEAPFFCLFESFHSVNYSSETDKVIPTIAAIDR